MTRRSAAPRQVTSGKYNHGGAQGGFDWSADGKTIYVSGVRKSEAEYLRNDSEIYVVDLASLEVKPLTDRKGPDGNPVVSPDGKYLAYTGYDDQMYTNHVSSLYLMDKSGGGKRLVGNLMSSPQNVVWAADNSGVYFSVEEKGSSHVYFAPANGAARQVTNGVHVLNGFSLANNGQAAAIRTSAQEPGALVTFNLKDAAKMTELVDVNADVMANVKLGDAEELWYTSKDGWKVQGWLIKPAKFETGKKYPMVCGFTAGRGRCIPSWNWAFQNFAANGYAVLYTNPRGSTGYGQDFVNGIQYSYPGKDYDDLMAGVDAALARASSTKRTSSSAEAAGRRVDRVDRRPHRPLHRRRLDAPVINWHSFVGTTDGASWYYQFQKRPWEDRWNSPRARRSITWPTSGRPRWSRPAKPTCARRWARAKSITARSRCSRKRRCSCGCRTNSTAGGGPSHQLAQQLYLMAWFEKHMRKRRRTPRWRTTEVVEDRGWRIEDGRSSRI